MRVGFSLLTLFPGQAGGSETYVRGLLDEFAAGRGPEALTVLANQRVMSAYRGAGVQLREVPAYRTGSSDLTRLLAMNAGRVRPVLGPHEFDVLHYPVTVPIPRVRSTPRVITLFDVQHHELRSMFSLPQRRLRRWAYDDAARSADVVVTISEHAKAGIVEHLGIPSERIRVIYLGVRQDDLYTPDGGRAPGMPERYVVYPANLWPHKNHRRLLTAFEQVDDESLHLVLTGQPYGHQASVTGKPRVHFLGHVPLDRLPGIYRGAIAMIFPSLFEGFGLPVLESMACGTPVACSDRGAVAEIAGAAALQFDPTDVDSLAEAVSRIVADQELRATLRTAGLARARLFTWAACAEGHLAVYRAAAAQAT